MAESQVPHGLKLLKSLTLESCPHCGIAHPYIGMPGQADFWMKTTAYDGKERSWAIYACSSCGRPVVATGEGGHGSQVTELYPLPKFAAEQIPERPREFLRQAILSVHTPAGAVMLCASAVDAMLTENGYKEETTLNQRIKKAVEDHLLTNEMANWAHHVRLEAIDQRHPERNAGFPTKEQAEQAIEFTEALGEILFVLPSRAKRGIQRAQAMMTSASSTSAVAAAIPTASS
jgi:hypothetical protein